MDFHFIDNLTHISKTQLSFAYEAAWYLTLSASIYFVLFGNVLSVSNMIGEILKSSFTESSRKKLTFISGLVFFSALIKILYHQHLTDFQPYDSPTYSEKTSAVRLIVSGFLIGLGSQYAKVNTNDTLSLDGIGRFSMKSIIGNIFVIIAACLTYTYRLHEYLPSTPRILDINLPDNITYAAYLLVCMLIPFFSFVISSKKSFKMLISYLSFFSVGVFYSFSLMFAEFTKRKTVYKYFQLDIKWNPNMFIIFLYGTFGSLIMFIVVRYFLKKPIFGTHVEQDQSKLKFNLVIGAIIYGIGWGIGGLRPAQVLILMPLQSIKIAFYWGISCLIGMKIAHKLFENEVTQCPVQIKSE